MLKIFIILVVVAAGAVGALEISEPFFFRWQDYEGTLPFSVLAGALGGLILSVVLLCRLFFWVFQGFRKRENYLHHKAYTKGENQLLGALEALLNQDFKTAAYRARKALKTLPQAHLPLVAEAASLWGEDAFKLYERLLHTPSTRFFGQIGLLDFYIQRKAFSKAKPYAEQAAAAHKNSPYLLQTLFALEVQTHQWGRAHACVKQLLKKNIITQLKAQELACFLHLKEGQLLSALNPKAALKSFLKAHQAAPHLLRVTLFLELRLQEAGEGRKAKHLLEKAWALFPHPTLLKVYARRLAEETPNPMEVFQKIEKLCSAHPHHWASHVSLAEAALSAKLWGVAHAQLEKAVDLNPSHIVYKLRAKLASIEKDTDMAIFWLEKAVSAASELEKEIQDADLTLTSLFPLGWDKPPAFFKG